MDMCRYCGLPTERDDLECEGCHEETLLISEVTAFTVNGWVNLYPPSRPVDVEVGWRL